MHEVCVRLVLRSVYDFSSLYVCDVYHYHTTVLLGP